MTMRLLAGLFGLSIVVSGASAQCTGNGGNGSLSHSLMAVGTTVETRVEGGAGQVYGVWASSGLTSIFLPNLGFVCIDPAAPVFFQALGGVVPPNGVVQSFFPVPPGATWLNIVYWLQGLVTDPTHPSGFALTRAVRKDYELPDTHVTTSPMLTARVYPRATTIEQNGLVLVTGGSTATDYFDGFPLPTTEHYDPVQRGFFPGPSMSTARVHHTQTRLVDGRILIVGGGTSVGGQATSSCQIYDPVTLSFQAASAMASPRLGHEAVLLDDGRVLVMGGTTSLLVDAGTPGFWPAYSSILQNAEIYDPALDLWAPVPGSMSAARLDFRAVKLADGRVLVISGVATASGVGNSPTQIEGSATCDLYVPSLGSFVTAAPLPAGAEPRRGFAATRLLSGEVVISGGVSVVPIGGSVTAGVSLTSVLAYDPLTNLWSQVADLNGTGGPGPTSRHTQILQDDGKLLILGGTTGGLAGSFSAATLYDPGTLSLSQAGSMSLGHSGHASVRLVEGAILSFGGRTGGIFTPGTPTAVTELYTPAF